MRFALRPILRLRRGQERNERRKLESISADVAGARLQLEQLTNMSFSVSAQIQDSLRTGALGSQLQLDTIRGENMIAARAAQVARLLELEKLRQAQMRTYMHARQQREIVESLFRRKLEIFKLEQRRREQQELDDLFLARQTILRDK